MLNRFILFTILFVLPLSISADSVELSVDTISCDQPRTDLEKERALIPEELVHLKDKLEDVHFKNFNLDSTQSIKLLASNKQKLTLANGDGLELEMLYLEDQRIGLWINWKDTSGMELLDTRMHFDISETMLAGAECEENKGKLLAVRVVE
jgi:hypothetical protein